MKRFGAMLRAMREEAGMKLTILASKAKASKGYISQIESGDAEAPQPAMVARIAKVLKADEKLLQILAHVDRAPKAVRESLSDAVGKWLKSEEGR